MAKFKIGDIIIVPAGTHMLGYYDSPLSDRGNLTKRDREIEFFPVSDLERIRHQILHHALKDDDIKSTDRTNYQQAYFDNLTIDEARNRYPETYKRIFDAYAATGISDPLDLIKLKDGWFVFADQCKLKPVVTEPVKKTKKKALTPVQELIKDSKWIAKNDYVFQVKCERADFARLVNNLYCADYPNAKPFDEYHAIAEKQVTRYDVADVFKVNAGDVVEVTGKLSDYREITANNGVKYFEKIRHCEVLNVTTGETGILTTTRDTLDQLISTYRPASYKYIIRNKVTGEFMEQKPTQYDGAVYVKYTADPSKALKFNNVGVVKNMIMNDTGYYFGMTVETDSFMANTDRKLYDFDRDWEVVGYDVATESFSQSEDLSVWYDGLMRYRNITLRFGSDSRTLYKKLEAKNKLDQYEAIVVFNNKDGAELYELDFEKVVDSVNHVLGTSEYFKVKTNHSFAVVVEKLSDAALIKLSYTGNDFDVKAFNIKDLTEVVE